MRLSSRRRDLTRGAQRVGRSLQPGMATLLCLACALAGAQSGQESGDAVWDAPHNGNPFIPGYFADASILQTPRETFLYATEDPWGSRELGCWHSGDLVHWQSCILNWPTKEQATSPTSNTSMVWAPSVVRRNGRYYMYVSVGSEVWVGVSYLPGGPWKNALGNRPLIPGNARPGYHMIDAEVFLDTDGQAYLYWGSGLHWVNGHCFVVRLKSDMVTFDSEPKDITPEHYFEAPFMFKHGGRYLLTYSEGKTTDTTYKVRYAVGDSPFGPFHEGRNSPLLVSDEKRSILGPGHHALFTLEGKTYIVYHRHSLPFDSSLIRRQLCMDELRFDGTGEPLKVLPTHAGPSLLHRIQRTAGTLPAVATASSAADSVHGASRVLDDNYATRWLPSAEDRTPWLQLDLGRVRSATRTEVRFEYAWKPMHFGLEASVDGTQWKPVTEHRSGEEIGSPFVVRGLPKARFFRLRFDASTEPPSIFEWTVF